MSMEKASDHKACPNCGRSLQFAPGVAKLFCPDCRAEFALEQRNDAFCVVESDYLSALRNLEQQDAAAEEQLVVSCANCGAEIVWPPNVVADRCGYCNSPVNGNGELKRLLKADYLLPFHLSETEAVKCFQEWLDKRYFLPSQLKRQKKNSALKGIYLPFWTYDCETETSYHGQRGTYYYVTVTYTERINGKSVTKTRLERRIRWCHVSGIVRNSFDDILIPASHLLPSDMLEKLEPWDLNNLVRYHSDFIRGFQMESYAVSLPDGFACAIQWMNPEIEQSIHHDIGGDEQQISEKNSKYDDICFKYILLPVYSSTFLWRGKLYRFVVNARTGEVQGERPWCVWKILFAVLAVAMTVLAIYYFMRHICPYNLPHGVAF